MLRTLSLIAIALFVIAGCSGDNTDQAANHDHEHGEHGHSHAEGPVQLTIAEFNEDGEAYEGKMVEIVGTVDHVCKHSGKRMFIHGENPEDRVKIEAGDVGTFDMGLQGSKVKVVAVGTVMKMDNAYLDNWAKEVGGADSLENCSEEQKELSKGQDDHEEHQSALDQINGLRQELADSGREYLAFCSLEAKSFQEIK
jgi:hypothetical protein